MMNEETRENAELVRKACIASYCMNYDTFVKIMHSGKKDQYTRTKFRSMQQDFVQWYCDLDTIHACKFMAYVLNKLEK